MSSQTAAAVPYDLPVLKIAPKEPRRLYTLEEYLEREERTVERYEFYDGILKKKPMARMNHNLVATNVGYALNSIFRAAHSVKGNSA